jgi:hypothetical protein
MNLVLVFPAALLGPVVLFAVMTSGVSAFWLLLPALVLGAFVAIGALMRRRLRVAGVVFLRMLLVVPALALLAFTILALATDPGRPWALWAIFAYAVLILVAGAWVPSKDAAHLEPRNA